MVGLLAGVLFGLFGVGGSRFATPSLGLLGIPGLFAVAAPLTATIPAALVGMIAYDGRHEVEWSVARWSVYGVSRPLWRARCCRNMWAGQSLLIACGVVLGAVGTHILLPLSEGRLAGIARRGPGVVVPVAAGIRLFTGLLANGGGFLLVPLFFPWKTPNPRFAWPLQLRTLGC